MVKVLIKHMKYNNFFSYTKKGHNILKSYKIGPLHKTDLPEKYKKDLLLGKL